MAEHDYSYETHLDVKFGALEHIKVAEPERSVILMVENAGIIPTGN